MILQHGSLRIEKTDEYNWTLSEKRVIQKDTEKSKAGDTYWRALSYHGSVEQALKAACRVAADGTARTWEEYLAAIEATWKGLMK